MCTIVESALKVIAAFHSQEPFLSSSSSIMNEAIYMYLSDKYTQFYHPHGNTQLIIILHKV